MGSNQSEIDQLKNDAKENFEQWTENQDEARASENRKIEAHYKEKIEQLENRYQQMDIDRKKKEDERVSAKADRIRHEKEKELRSREERETQEKLRVEEEEKGRIQNIARLRADMNELKPGLSFEFPDENIIFPKRLNIGLFGVTGIGKTSLMNSLKFAVNGELKEIDREQAAPPHFQGGHTTRRMAVRITKYLTFVDNRGISAEDLVKDGAAEELILQLEGKSSFASEVDWGKSSRPDDMEVDETKKIYCTVLVFSARSISAIQTIIGKFVERLLTWQGRFPIAVITHVDEATPEQIEQMRILLMMAGIVDIYEVANITNEKEKLEPMYQENLLKLLHKCIKDGDRIFELRHELILEGEKREKRKSKIAN